MYIGYIYVIAVVMLFIIPNILKYFHVSSTVLPMNGILSVFKEANFSDDAFFCFNAFYLYSYTLNFHIAFLLHSLVYFVASFIIS